MPFGLSTLVLLPLLGALVVLAIPNARTQFIRALGLSISCITFLYSLVFGFNLILLHPTFNLSIQSIGFQNTAFSCIWDWMVFRFSL
jgi:NADH:ubiquinone oxidoreductase subunit 4 (subunit M)